MAEDAGFRPVSDVDVADSVGPSVQEMTPGGTGVLFEAELDKVRKIWQELPI
jgi:hypothetical protein